MAPFKKDYIIGLDIGSSSVKMAQFAERESGLSLVGAGLKELKSAEGDSNFEGEAIAALRHLLRGVNIKKSKVIATVNSSDTAVKKIMAPYMPKAELREGIKLEAKNYFPFPIDNSSLDFEVSGDVMDKGVRKYEALVAVCPKKVIDRCLKLLARAGIRPASIVPSSYALQKFGALSRGAEARIECLVDIGRFHTELVIVRGSEPVFSRKIPVAGDDFTKSMTGALVSDKGRAQLTLNEAEKIKQDVGIPAEGDSRVIDGNFNASQIRSMMLTPLEQLSSEIARCFDYYREETSGGMIDSLILFGAGASLNGLARFLSKELAIDVRLGDSFESFKMGGIEAKEQARLSYRIEMACGAALNGPKGLNLLPPEIKEEVRRVVARGTIEAIATAIILISVFLYTGLRIQLTNFTNRIAVAKLELSSLEPQLKKAQAQALAGRVLIEEPQWEDIFRELSNIIPDTIHLEKLRMEKDIMTLNGIISSEDGEQILSDFILTLERGIFNNVKLVSTRDLSEGLGVEFELKCWIDYEDR